jgi:hypothetical protein
MEIGPVEFLDIYIAKSSHEIGELSKHKLVQATQIEVLLKEIDRLTALVNEQTIELEKLKPPAPQAANNG